MLRSGAAGALERVLPCGGGLPSRAPSPSTLLARPRCYAVRRSISSSFRTLGRRTA